VIPQTKFQAAPNCRMKRHKSVEFLSIFKCQAPLKKRKGLNWKHSGDCSD